MSELPPITIAALDPTGSPNREHLVPAMREGLTVHLLVQQMLGLLIRADLAGKLFAEDMAFTPVGGIASTTVQAAVAEIDAEKQALNANLTALAGLTGASDRVAYFTAAETLALATLTTFGRSLMDDADAAAGRGTLGAVAIDAGAGGIGLCLLAENNSAGTVNSGDTVAGSSLRTAVVTSGGAVVANATPALSGTWRNVTSAVAVGQFTVFQRIS